MKQKINTPTPCYLSHRVGGEVSPPTRWDRVGRGLKAFTLMELMVVLIIIGILSSIALPGYNRMKERALGKEAITNLKLIAAAERVYRVENGTWYPPSGTVSDIDMINTNLKLSLSNSAGKYWSYSVLGTDQANPAAQAVRTGTGGYLDCWYPFFYATDPDGEPSPGTSQCP